MPETTKSIAETTSQGVRNLNSLGPKRPRAEKKDPPPCKVIGHTRTIKNVYDAGMWVPAAVCSRCEAPLD